MIRTVHIPTKVSRMGCAPGSGCCDECSHTGPPIGAPEVHVHQIPSERNSALRASLGTVNCDQDGNCYDDSTGVYTPAPVSSSGVTSGLSNTTLYIAGAVLLIGLLELTSRRR